MSSDLRLNVEALRSRLSRQAAIYQPGSKEFQHATDRWSIEEGPSVSMVVVPATENDVAETVKYANDVDMPFLAQSAGHGAITTVGRMKDGIQIWLNKLVSIDIAEDGETVEIGGGTLSKELVHTLWASGKQTVTGACESTSILGPGLGGGHGILQGHHGLIADQFVSLRLVQADGTVHSVDKTSDLWWAMRGAGHNFGIVTAATMKIYDIKYPNWAYRTWIFPGAAVEDLYQAASEHLLPEAKRSAQVLHFTAVVNIPEIDPEHSLLVLYIFQEGVDTVHDKFTEPFMGLRHLHTAAATGPYTDIPKWGGLDNESPSCQKLGQGNFRFPADLVGYNPSALRKMYDTFSINTHKHPELGQSMILLEGYSLPGVQAVPSDSTAFPNRHDNIVSVAIMRFPAGQPNIKAKAIEVGEAIRKSLHEGDGREELHAYVNYAYGSEKKESLYGYESWRQEKLLALKDKYDPRRRFSFYAPIA